MTGLRVQRHRCRTCIYRKNSPLDIAALEDEIRDPGDGFRGYRVCHQSDTACCSGFWDKHKDEFRAGQLAQRLDLVEFVDDDTLAAAVDLADLNREIEEMTRVLGLAAKCGFAEMVAEIYASIETTIIPLLDQLAAVAKTADDRRELRERCAKVHAIALRSGSRRRSAIHALSRSSRRVLRTAGVGNSARSRAAHE